MKKASEGQFHDLMSKLLVKTNREEIDSQKMQNAIDSLNSSNSVVAESFVDWINHNNDRVLQISDSFNTIEPLSISIPALPRPTLEELQKRFSWIKSIERDTSPTEAIILNLATVLRPSDDRISGKEYEARINLKLDLILGYQQALWLVEHQDEFPEFMKLLGKIYIDFSGLVVVVRHGRRNISYLVLYGKRWSLFWAWFGGDFRRAGRVAFSGK